jgi:hypothetical protein
MSWQIVTVAPRDGLDRINRKLMPKDAEACQACRRIKPIRKFPPGVEPKRVCLDCLRLWHIFGQRPDPSWREFTCEGCGIKLSAPKANKGARNGLCPDCYRSWDKFDRDLRARFKEWR